MTVQRAIVAFPVFACTDLIEGIRRRFDPMASVLGAHVTLVFPFESPVSSAALVEHVTAAVTGMAPFDIGLEAPTAASDNYVFLNVKDGVERFVALHDRLHAKVLRSFLSRSHPYSPHVTIGRLAGAAALAVALTEARAVLTRGARGHVDSLAIFRIDETANGVVECTIPLDRVA